MQYEKVLRGKIVQGKVFEGEIGINNGRIEKVIPGFNQLNSMTVENYESGFIFPGFIDVHVHCFSNPNEGFISTSGSAAVGGITTFFDMPYDQPNPINNVESFKQKVMRLEKEAIVDICLWGTIKKKGGLDQIVPLSEAGAVGFKLSTFESDPNRFPRITDDEIMKAMNIIKEMGLIAAFHSENEEIVVNLIEDYKGRNKVYPKAHNETRPPVTETSAVLKLLEFAYWTGVKLHIVHVSHPRSMELIKLYRKQGVKVSCETCYSYLQLNIEDLDKYGPNAKINPPLRERSEVEGLWSHLYKNDIDMISSDHAPWGEDYKDIGNENIFLAAAGLPGIEIMVPLLFSSVVSEGKLTPVKFAELLSTHPAKIFQLKNKGLIKEGFDADFTIIDPEATWKIDEKKFKSSSKKTPFHGKEIKGKIISTFVRGTKVYDGRNIKVQPGYGKFVPGSAYKGNLIKL